jgi:hypothetical protein
MLEANCAGAHIHGAQIVYQNNGSLLPLLPGMCTNGKPESDAPISAFEAALGQIYQHS